MLAFPSPPPSPRHGTAAERRARVAWLVRALQRLLAESQAVLAAVAADPAAAGDRARELRRLQDETRRLLAELEGLAPPAEQPGSSSA